MKKKFEKSYTIELDESTIGEAIRKLLEVKKELAKAGAEVFKVHTDGNDYNGWIDIEYKIEETDEQYEKRLKSEKDYQDSIQINERIQYEKLRLKFDPTFEPSMVYESGGIKYWLKGGKVYP